MPLRVTRREIVISLPALAIAPPAEAQTWPILSPPRTLEEMARRVEREFPSVRHFSPAELARRLQAGRVHMFDVREAAEFEVSHLAGAERIDPGARTAAVLDQVGPRAAGADIVFYCSVGQRSSRMAARAQGALTERGAHAIFNLRGGVFGWHNEQRALVNASGPTPNVHPYNAAWGRLLTHPELASTCPPNGTRRPTSPS